MKTAKEFNSRMGEIIHMRAMAAKNAAMDFVNEQLEMWWNDEDWVASGAECYMEVPLNICWSYCQDILVEMKGRTMVVNFK